MKKHEDRNSDTCGGKKKINGGIKDGLISLAGGAAISNPG